MTTTAPRSNSTRTLTRAATALAAALVPVLAGLALLCSERARRKAIALIGGDHTASAPAQIGKTWAIGLLIIGALQALGSLALGLSITDPAAVLLRTMFALAAEALLLLLTTRTAANRTPAD